MLKSGTKTIKNINFDGLFLIITDVETKTVKIIKYREQIKDFDVI